MPQICSVFDFKDLDASLQMIKCKDDDDIMDIVIEYETNFTPEEYDMDLFSYIIGKDDNEIIFRTIIDRKDTDKIVEVCRYIMENYILDIDIYSNISREKKSLIFQIGCIIRVFAYNACIYNDIEKIYKFEELYRLIKILNELS